jgi:EAL domain-containing protein (putative c-di-GMP-specific phosphodiesterase class I)
MTKEKFLHLYKKGETIFNEGDPADCAYLIESGKVEIFRERDGAHTPVAILGPGEIFGEMGILDESSRIASAKALAHCEFTVIHKEQINERMSSADPIIKLVMNILIDRMRGTFQPKDQNAFKKMKTKNLKASPKKALQSLEIKTEEEVIDKIRFENDLHKALENDEYTLFFQPIFGIDNYEINGFEALIRWNSPIFGMVRPDIFMGVAEETSLIIPLGRWIVEEAIRNYAEFKHAAHNSAVAPEFIAINISGRQLADKELLPTLDRCVEKYGIAPSEVKLEITERVLVDVDHVFEWINDCRSRGYSIALDDFGTGYSSLSYLNKLNVNNLKIDKSFVQNMDDHNTMVIVKSIIDMCKGLKKSLVAEGIETVEQYEMLKELGCELGQGYLYSKPMPMEELIAQFIKSVDIKKKAA